MLRAGLLALAGNRWLGSRLPRSAVGRRMARRFIPGERLEDAVEAASRLRAAGLASVLTHLGEDVNSGGGADAAASGYESALGALAAAGLEPQVSVKPTHLGLALDAESTLERIDGLARAAAVDSGFVWIDMEGSAYTEATVAIYERLRAAHPNVGLCLQAYLKRTPDDVDRLLPLKPSIRLVKGAYREPSSTALTDKKDVDRVYAELAQRLREGGAMVGLATHDIELLERIGGDSEVQMLYGIRTDQQRRLAASGRRVRVLVSYGSEWFAWYMRRLAERPANLLFALRAVAARPPAAGR
jgi:proline dehydrogenase